MKKAVITVVGKDCIGIIAKVCTYLAENNINILDISQTIVQDYFNMMMIVDFSKTEKDFLVAATELERLGENIGVVIKTQREELIKSQPQSVQGMGIYLRQRSVGQLGYAAVKSYAALYNAVKQSRGQALVNSAEL